MGTGANFIHAVLQIERSVNGPCICFDIHNICIYIHLKADTHRTRFGNAARFFIFQKQINRSTIENFGKYEKYTTLAVEML